MLRLRSLLVLAVVCTALTATSASASAKRLPLLKVVPKPAHGALSRTIGTKGGTIRVKAPHGITVTLSIPAGALQTPTLITMTPLAAVKRVPFKRGVVGAVKLAPEGLTLMHPAKLTIRPKKRVPLARQTSFSATGGGASFHVYPGKRARTALTLPLFHFSIYGESDASPAEQARESHRDQSDAQFREERDLADARSQQAMAEALYQWVDYLANYVKEAASNDAYADDAIDQALSLAEELRLYDWSSELLPPHMGDQIPKSVDPALRARLEDRLAVINTYFPDKILDNALQAASDRCTVLHQPAQAHRILSIQEMRRFFGETAEVDLGPVEKCLTFELDIDTEFHTSQPEQPNEIHAQTKIPLQVSPSLSFWRGTGQVKYLSVSGSDVTPCTYTAQGSGSWDAQALGLAPGKIARNGGQVAPMQVQYVSVLSPNTEEDSTVTCPSGSDSGRSSRLSLERAVQDAELDAGERRRARHQELFAFLSGQRRRDVDRDDAAPGPAYARVIAPTAVRLVATRHVGAR
jgi:hypothetical protein